MKDKQDNDARSTNTPEEFSLLLDGRLEPDEARDTQSRIQADPELSETFDTLKEAREALRENNDMAKLPQGFDSRLRMRIRNADIQQRSEYRIDGEEGFRGGLWAKSILAIGAFAAGVMIMLALGFDSGIEEWFEGEASAGFATSPGNISTNNEASYTADMVKPLIETQFREYRNLQKQIALSEEVDPVWLREELAITELPSKNQQLLRLTYEVKGPRREEYIIALKGVDSAIKELSVVAQNTADNQSVVSTKSLIHVLAGIPTPLGMESLAFDVHILKHAPGSVQCYETTQSSNSKYQNKSSNFIYSPEELEMYISGRKAYQDKKYKTATKLFKNYLSGYSSDSKYFLYATCYASRAMTQSDDPAGARDLVDVVSEKRPQILLLFEKEEISALCSRNPDEEVNQYSCWVNSHLGGASKLHFYEPSATSTSAPFQTNATQEKSPVNQALMINQRLQDIHKECEKLEIQEARKKEKEMRRRESGIKSTGRFSDSGKSKSKNKSNTKKYSGSSTRNSAKNR